LECDLLETRFRQYPPRPKANQIVRDGKVKYIDDPGGKGYEIVKEVTACPRCAVQYRQKSDK
jgi:hypothetical protein